MKVDNTVVTEILQFYLQDMKLEDKIMEALLDKDDSIKAKIKLIPFLEWLHDNDNDSNFETLIECLSQGCEPYADTVKDTDTWNDGCYRNPNHIVNIEELKEADLINFNEDGSINDVNIFKENLQIEWV